VVVVVVVTTLYSDQPHGQKRQRKTYVVVFTDGWSIKNGWRLDGVAIVVGRQGE
jgi:hypothetical protein